jgi:cytochrome P450
MPKLLRRPLQLLTSVASEYGDVALLPVGPQRIYLLNHPDYFKHVLQDHYRNYHKGVSYKTLKLLVGEGLGTSDGAFWLRQRRLAQPAFHHQRLATMASAMAHATAEMLQHWETIAACGDAFDVVTEMRRLTLQIIVTTMFSTAIGNEAETVYHAFNTALTHITRSFWLSGLPPRLTPGYRTFQQAVNVLDTVVYRIINERRQTEHDPGDLLTMFLQAADAETGEGMNDKQVRDELMTLFIAGYDTSAHTLAWVWHLLTQHPEVERRLYIELSHVLNGRIPTFSDLPHLVYTRMIIEEAMRLYPAAWGVFRMSLADDIIGGYTIPAGSVIILSPYVMHRTPAYWEQPERFEPERFTPDRLAERPRYTYVPFGGGPRQCIGNNFAMMEMQLILAMVAQRYQLQSVPGQLVEPHIALTLQPRRGVQVTLRPR